VLAGGASTRYGSRNKLLEPFEGSPLIKHVVRTVRRVGDVPPIVTVRTAHQRTAIGDAVGDAVDIRFRFDAPAFEGPLAGIVGALPAVTAPWLFVCAGDMPCLSAEAISRLAACRDEGTDAVVPTWDGRREPLHALYRRSALERAVESVPTDAGVQSVCSVLSTTDVPVTGASDPLTRSLRNVNTPEDLERIRTGSTSTATESTDNRTER